MRLFIAITLSEKAKTSLCSAMDGLRRDGVRGRFTAPEKLHLTLAFLGEREDSTEAERVLAGLSFRPFFLTLSGSGSFGDVLWAGVERSPQLEALDAQLRAALTKAGIAFDPKPFRPHITLVRGARSPEGVSPRVERCRMKVTRVSLLRSVPVDGAVQYREICSADGSGRKRAEKYGL